MCELVRSRGVARYILLQLDVGWLAVFPCVQAFCYAKLTSCWLWPYITVDRLKSGVDIVIQFSTRKQISVFPNISKYFFKVCVAWMVTYGVSTYNTWKVSEERRTKHLFLPPTGGAISGE